jgi:hypothetical protein
MKSMGAESGADDSTGADDAGASGEVVTSGFVDACEEQLARMMMRARAALDLVMGFSFRRSKTIERGKPFNWAALT